MRIQGLNQLEGTVHNGYIIIRWIEIDAVRFNLHSILYLMYLHLCVFLQERTHDTLIIGSKVLNNHNGKVRLRRHTDKKPLKCLKASGRGPDTDNWKRFTVSTISAFAFAFAFAFCITGRNHFQYCWCGFLFRLSWYLLFCHFPFWQWLGSGLTGFFSRFCTTLLCHSRLTCFLRHNRFLCFFGNSHFLFHNFLFCHLDLLQHKFFESNHFFITSEHKRNSFKQNALIGIVTVLPDPKRIIQ